MSGSFDRVMEDRKQLVNQIIDNMKNGYILPKPQWNSQIHTFHNPVSNACYRGANVLRLWLTSVAKNYTDLRFMTYKQAQSKGYKVKKGEKGVRLEKYIFTKQQEVENPDTGEMEKVTVRLQRPMVNSFVVFNAAQIEGIPPMEEMENELEYNEVIELADELIASSECPIYEKNQGDAFYSPHKDEITLPPRNSFISQEAFVSTMMHEMIHSTGHESRLNRPILNRFGSPEYAMEELRAELGSFFMGTDLGIEGSEELLASHTHYLESWIKALQDDPNELFRACSDAQKAVERLDDNLQQYREQQNEMDYEHKMEYLNQVVDEQSDDLLAIQDEILSNMKESNFSNMNEMFDSMFKAMDDLCDSLEQRTKTRLENMNQVKEKNSMLEGRKITVKIFDVNNREIQTRNTNKVFEVYKQDNKIGIDWKENEFAALNTFSHNVIFTDVETGQQYYHSNIENGIVKVATESNQFDAAIEEALQSVEVAEPDLEIEV